jgi:protein arginine kinase activator
MQTCQSCGRRPAEIEFIQVTGDVRREMALCRECALTVGMRAQVEAFQRLSQLLMQQHGPQIAVSEDMKAAMSEKCSRCGLAFEQFVETGLLGCPQCYVDFQNLLQPVLRRMHGVTRQTDAPAESPPRVPEPRPEKESIEETRTRREQIEMELHLALLEEDYEKAASLRDKLKSLS